MEWIIEMVNEYVYLIGMTDLQQDVAKRQAEALSWVKNAQGIPTENKQLSNTAEEIQQGLAKNPLLMFLYSLSLGLYNKRLADLGIERLLAGQKQRKA
jgi:aspartate/glutamate racemase